MFAYEVRWWCCDGTETRDPLGAQLGHSMVSIARDAADPWFRLKRNDVRRVSTIVDEETWPLDG